MTLYGVRVIVDSLTIHIHQQYYSSWMYRTVLPMLEKQLKRQIEQSIEDYIALAFHTTAGYLDLLRDLVVPSPTHY